MHFKAEYQNTQMMLDIMKKRYSPSPVFTGALGLYNNHFEVSRNDITYGDDGIGSYNEEYDSANDSDVQVLNQTKEELADMLRMNGGRSMN